MKVSGKPENSISLKTRNPSPDSDLQPPKASSSNRRRPRTPLAQFRKNGAPTGRRSRPETPLLKWKTHEKGKNDDPLEDDENKSSAGFGGGRAKGNKKQKEAVVSVRKLAAGLWRLQLPETTAVARFGVQVTRFGVFDFFCFVFGLLIDP